MSMIFQTNSYDDGLGLTVLDPGTQIEPVYDPKAAKRARKAAKRLAAGQRTAGADVVDKAQKKAQKALKKQVKVNAGTPMAGPGSTTTASTPAAREAQSAFNFVSSIPPMYLLIGGGVLLYLVFGKKK